MRSGRRANQSVTLSGFRQMEADKRRPALILRRKGVVTNNCFAVYWVANQQLIVENASYRYVVFNTGEPLDCGDDRAPGVDLCRDLVQSHRLTQPRVVVVEIQGVADTSALDADFRDADVLEGVLRIPRVRVE